MPENLVSRDGFSRPVPRQPAHLHTQAESGAYLRDSSRVPYNVGEKPTVNLYLCMVITYSRVWDQPGKVANPARGQLNRVH